MDRAPGHAGRAGAMAAMSAALASWRAVLGIKWRALARLERALAAQRAALAECRSELTGQERALADSQAGCARQDRRLAALLDADGGFAVHGYLAHEAERARLQLELRQADAALQAGRQRLAAQHDEVGATQREIGRVEAQRDLSLEQIAKLERERLAAEELAQDEESAEASMARHFRAAREAREAA
ncbi:hypothetical protein D0T25_24260 [Duganella sp. BJB488]|nr:hypothetical protein D0T26_23360 [Duganella sp. BJB489]RFP17196.1 hypothetical protein D0T25_24260 [Duganella sp. BJB488]RFP31584.1 hypothetical protein D0T24_24455 [Duganella sp. BJB480]